MGAIPLPLPSSSSSPHLILRRLLRPIPPLVRRSFLPSTTTPLHVSPILTSTTTTFLPPFSSHSLSLSSTSFLPHSISASQQLLDPPNDVNLEEEPDNDDYEAADEDKVVDSDEESENESNNSKTNVLAVNAKPTPSLSIKEKKELASHAHSLGKKLKSQQVGKSGVTDTVITALVETLEKNELLKLKIHGNCPAELDDAVKQVEMGTGSVVVSQIGRTVILYRPSVSKLQAEQKKKQTRRKLMKKRSVWVRSSSQSKEEMPKLSARGRRGSSRV